MMRRSMQKTFLPGFVQPIGGKVDLNEDPLSAAKRELMEEAGLQVANLKLKAIVTEIKSKEDRNYQTNWQIFHFVGQFDAGDVGTTDEGELIWLTLDEIKKEKLTESIRTIIDQILDESSKVIFATFTYGKNNVLLEKDVQAI